MSERVAFVLGGGGVRGAVEVGMLRALLEAGVRPDVVVGTSIGAVNGALVAADPTPGVVPRLVRAWTSPDAAAVYGDSWARQVRRLAFTRTHLNSAAPLRRLLERELGEGVRFADLPVPLHVVAASIERAAEHWFDSGEVIPAVLASASVPGVLPATRIDGEHFIDGGIVNSIPVERAVQQGADVIYVLQVGRVEEPLRAPRNALQTAQVTFEIARRHRFAKDLATLPPGVQVHVLPTGGRVPADRGLRAFKSLHATTDRMEQAYGATLEYLADREG